MTLSTALNQQEGVVEAVPVRRGVLRRMLRQPTVLIAGGFLLLLAFVAVFAPVLTPYDPNISDVPNRLQGPSTAHWLGTDDLGRDLLTRVMYAASVALMASGQAVGLGLIVGIPVGLLIAYRRGAIEKGVLYFADVQQAIPMIMLAFAFAALFGRGLSSAMLAVSVGFAVQYIRLTRAIVLAEREQPYVEATEVQGYPLGRILFRHILPNAVGPLAVQTSIVLGVAILTESTLSFLGLGVDTLTPSWGAMLSQAQRFQMTQPLLMLVPGIAITLTVLAFNLLGDGLADAFGRSRGRTPRRRAAAGIAAIPALESGPLAVTADDTALLRIEGLTIQAPREAGEVSTIVDGIGFEIAAGEIFGLVGESGSGKSMTSSALLGMVPSPAAVTAGSIRFSGRELAGLGQGQWQRIRGREIAAVFQDPMAALSPLHPVGRQITEAIHAHEHVSRQAARARAAALLDRVGVPDPEQRLDDYPHQFSGGMAQRAMIAASLASNPRLLIADEPTTALDATVQRQVLQLLRELSQDLGMAVLFISHDLGVVAELCSRVAVMREGRLVETGPTSTVLTRPSHEYTRQLLAARSALLSIPEGEA